MKFAIKKIAASVSPIRVLGSFFVILMVMKTPAWAGVAVQHWVQPSGAKVYLIESHSIPMLDVQVAFDAGGRRDPATQAGLASFTAGMLSKGVLAKGGQPALDENQLGEAWADLGAQFGGGADSDGMGFQLRTLVAPELLQPAIALAARQLGEPAFLDAIWQRERERSRAALREADTRPAVIARRAYSAAVYGQHPYGYRTTEAPLDAINVQAMRALHARSLQACRAKVSVVGDVTRSQADALVTALLERLPHATDGCTPLLALGEIAALSQAENIRLPFNAAQAQVYVGQPGYPRTDPQHLALTVGNYVLGGGGFVSRLTQEVREKRGLTYGVGSGFSPGLHAGTFTVGLQTRPDQADEAVALVQRILADFVAQGPTSAELRAAKDHLIGSFALSIDSNRELLASLANMARHDLPLDYLDTWSAAVDKITVADVKTAFQAKVQPDRLVTVIVGAKP